MDLCFRILVLLVSASVIQAKDHAKQEVEVLVNLPTLGTIKGREHQTVQGRTYYNFRNIPFAESTAGQNRFKVDTIFHIGIVIVQLYDVQSAPKTLHYSFK